MSAKTMGLFALGVLSVGILVGFIAGALSVSSPGVFSATRMFTAWSIFGFISLIMFGFALFLKDKELLSEQNKPDEDNENNTGITGATDNPGESPVITISGNNNLSTENTDESTINTDTFENNTSEDYTTNNADVAFCLNCGHDLSPDDIICPNCSTPVN